jgi:hypothetical protein
MADQKMDGYAVEAAGLRDFRDGTLAKVAEGLPDLHHAIASASIPYNAFPAVVADASKSRKTALDELHVAVLGTQRHVEGHIEKVDAAKLNYDEADLKSSPITPQADGQPGVQGEPSSSSSAPKRSTVKVPSSLGANAANLSGHSLTDLIFRFHRILQEAAGCLGLGHLVQPVGKYLHANVRSPGQFLQAAERLDKVGLSVIQLHSSALDGLNRLSGRWVGQAHESHRDWMQATYRQHFDGDIQAQARTQSDKDRRNAQSIQDTNSLILLTIQKAALALLAIMTMIVLCLVAEPLVAEGLMVRAAICLMLIPLELATCASLLKEKRWAY